MTLANASDQELWKLRDELMRGFQSRDQIWKDRRKIRYRQMGQELEALPLNPQVTDRALMVYQTELPNQEVHKRTKRLIANKPRWEVVLLKPGADFQSQGQDLENGIKALYNWMNRGKPTTEWKLVEHQQGDGLGIIKVDFIPGHGITLGAFDIDDLTADDEDESIEGASDRNTARSAFRDAMKKHSNEGKAFDEVTNDVLRAEFPPFRITAVDPLNCYWYEDDDGVAVMLETGQKALNPLLEAFSDYGLKFDKDTGKVFIVEESAEAVGTHTSLHDSSGADISQRVTYTEVRTRETIYVMIEHPKLSKNAPRSAKGDSNKGVVFKFPNPFGPRTVGYALVPGDVTTDDDPANKYQPVIEGVLSTAQALNVLMTARLSASLEEALAAPYLRVTPEQEGLLPPNEEKAPSIDQANRNIPTVPGEIKRVESPRADIDRAEGRLIDETLLYKMAEAQQGEATSDTSGHRLAIQVAQADIQQVPYQNARKQALEEIMKGIVYAVRKHGLPVYIPTLPETARRDDKLRVADMAVITPEMADLPFELIVTLGAETPVTKYAKWAALRDRMEAGTAGYQTVVEQSDTEDPDEEIARVFEGKMLIATMEQLIPTLAELAVAYGAERVKERLTGGEPTQPEGDQLALGLPPESGLVAGGGGGTEADDLARVSGVNMPIAPSTSDFGPPVMEGVEVGT